MLCGRMEINMFIINPQINKEEFENEVVLISPLEEIHCLNQTGSEVWKMIEIGYGLDEIVNTLSNKYNIERSIIMKDVKEIVDMLITKKLITVK